MGNKTSKVIDIGDYSPEVENKIKRGGYISVQVYDKRGIKKIPRGFLNPQQAHHGGL